MKIFKSLFLFAGLALAGATASAVPARPGIRTFTQPDGSSISLRLVGDEFFHTYVTTDGLSVARAADGSFRYVSAEGLSDMTVHNPEARSAAEKGFISAMAGSLSPSQLVASRGAKARARSLSAPLRASQVPSTGSPKVPVLLVQYADYHFKDADPMQTFQNFFNGEGKSALKYFTDQSNGLYTPSFELYGPVTLSGKRADYGGNDYSGNDKGVGTMVGQACQLLDSSINFSDYDNDGDGECDVIIVIYAGDGEASSYDDDSEDAVWPCQWALSSSDFRRALNLDNTRVDKFAVFNELNGSDLSRIDGIGTFCHEYSHCLDLPDFYDTNYNGHFGMSYWSLLDTGCYNDDGYTPIGYTAYEKEFMGWMEIPEAEPNTFYTLKPLNAGDDMAVRLTNPADPDEYFVIENRSRQGWDQYMPADGLLIYHVTYDASAWAGNYVNDYDMQRMTPVPADNNLKMTTYSVWGETYYEVDMDNLAGDLWPYGGNDELTDSSSPAASVNHGTALGKPVTEMTRNADGSVSFWAMKGRLPQLSAPAFTGYEVENNSILTLHWLPVEEADATYTLEVVKHGSLPYDLVSATDFTNDQHGWATTGYTVVDTDENALKLGSNKQAGSVTSPVFKSGDTGEVTLFATTRNYGNDNTTVTVDLLSASGTVLDTKTFVPLSSGFSEQRILLQGTPESDVKVRVQTTSTRKRFYIRSASIYTGDATQITDAPARSAVETGDTDSRTVTGISGTSYRITGLEVNGMYDYRVKAVPVDADSFAESNWSRTGTADLSVNVSGVGSVPTDSADAPALYFNLQGFPVVPDTPGIYIRRQGDRSEKVMIR